MFWGLIMEPGRCYTQTVKVAFHVSMAALDISNSGDEPVQVMCVFEGRNYLLCSLNRQDKWQCALDLNFEVGSKVSFATNGNSHVHLSGYLTDLQDELDEEEVEEEESPKSEKKRSKKQHTDGPPSKKSKGLKETVVEEEDSDESDSDFDLNHIMQESEEEEESAEEEESVEEEGGVEEEEEASSLSDEESEDEKEVTPKQNGVAKPTPQKKKNEEKPKPQEEKKGKQKPKKTVLKGGVIVEDLKEGSGPLVTNGKFVHVYYEGRFKDSNKMFDSTTKGPGFSFRVGKGEVIKGWDVGLVGMKVGGKRRILCPPKMAYGPKGSPPVIPPNANLVFDVELKKVS